jgi:SAM-dependent methyltransferase
MTEMIDASPDKAFYDSEPIEDDARHAAFMGEIRSYFGAYSRRLSDDLAGTAGIVVELGAGSCGLSCCLSRLDGVTKVYSADISAQRMDRMLKTSARMLDGDVAKIETIECDFNHRLPFETGSVDAVLFDAALHHTRTMWGLIAECRRILRPKGRLVAQRESYLNALRASKQLGELLITPEVSAQVSENMYLEAQYEYYLKVSGFEVTFIRHSVSARKRMMRFANGWLFSDGILYCTKR